MKKFAFVLVLVLLILSVGLNVLLFSQFQGKTKVVSLNNANLRENYETVHKVKEAQKLNTGKGIKVGILDKYFGYSLHPDLYTWGENFTGDNNAYNSIEEHGYWMALTLREIAPDVEIYALNARSRNRDEEADAIVRAIDWAIEEGIDILTYSADPFQDQHRPKIDEAVNKAVNNNIVTTFIHYPNPNNILPFGLFLYDGFYEREPDVRILHYDYNTLIMKSYEKYVQEGRVGTSGDAIPYFSMSSTSVVLAGFIALLKEVRNDLAPDDYRKILKKTSYDFEYDGIEIPRVVDIYMAIQSIN